MSVKKCGPVIDWLDDKRSTAPPDVGWCTGYVQALIETNNLFGTSDNAPYTKQPAFFCPTEGARTVDAIRAVVNFMRKRKYSSKWEESFVALVALRAKWPCKSPSLFGEYGEPDAWR